MAILAALVFVFATLGIVAYALFQVGPFAHHVDHYRDSRTGKRLFASPHLETWDEFEQRTHDNLN